MLRHFSYERSRGMDTAGRSRTLTFRTPSPPFNQSKQLQLKHFSNRSASVPPFSSLISWTACAKLFELAIRSRGNGGFPWPGAVAVDSSSQQIHGGPCRDKTRPTEETKRGISNASDGFESGCASRLANLDALRIKRIAPHVVPHLVQDGVGLT